MDGSYFNYKYNYKVIIIGDAGVGKTSILQNYVTKKFNKVYDLTIGVDFEAKKLYVKDENGNDIGVKLQIWDTAGQEAFHSIVETYYRTAIGALVVFDITDAKTFNNVKKWINEVKEFSFNDIKIILIGNKTDLNLKRQVSREDAEAFAYQTNIDYLEASAKTGSLVSHIFEKLAQDIYNIYPNKFFNNGGNIVGISPRENISIIQTSNKAKCNNCIIL